MSTASGAAQRGAAAVTILLLMLSLVAMLGLVEIGYLYWNKRDLQKLADVAALAGAQRLSIDNISEEDNDLCSLGQAAAKANLEENDFDGEISAIECRHWSSSNTSDDLTQDVDADNAVNAIRVVLQRSPVPFFGQAFSDSELTLEAKAVATQNSPQVAFSVGSGLLGINGDAPLQGLLKLVGVDLSDTEVASYSGLANVSVTTSGLLKALGIDVDADITVGELQALLDAQNITLTQLLSVAATLLSDQEVAGVDLDVLSTSLASADLSDVSITLGDLLNITSTDASSALDVDLNLLDLLGAAITVAGKGHAVSIGSLDLLGGISVQASIIEAASIGIGPVGTTAYNAQVRLYLSIDTDNITALGTLLKLLAIRIQLPVYIDVVDAQATVTAIDCNSTPRNATFEVVSTVSNICIGSTSTPWYSTSDVCGSNLQDVALVTLLGTSLSGKVALDALESTEDLTVNEGETGSTNANNLAIGSLLEELLTQALTLVENLLTQILNSLSLPTLVTQLLSLALGTLTSIVNAVVAAVVALLEPLLNGIGQLLSDLLANVLGLELGVTDVDVQSIQCDSVRLVH
ncbi:MAG: TadG family pilus assembly protein [Pseudomonas sp.]